VSEHIFMGAYRVTLVAASAGTVLVAIGLCVQAWAARRGGPSGDSQLVRGWDLLAGAATCGTAITAVSLIAGTWHQMDASEYPLICTVFGLVPAAIAQAIRRRRPQFDRGSARLEWWLTAVAGLLGAWAGWNGSPV
jgi:hypothetical protein